MREEPARADDAQCLVLRQRREPRLAGGGGVQRHLLPHVGVVAEPGGRTLGARDPGERLALDHGEPAVFLRAAREPVEDLLHDVGDHAHVEVVEGERREAQRQRVVQRVGVLHHPAAFHQRREDAVHGALRRVDPRRDVTELEPADGAREALQHVETSGDRGDRHSVRTL